MQTTFRLKRSSKFELQIPVDDPDNPGQLADLTGYSAVAHLRRYSTSETYQPFGVALDPAGTITLSLTAAETATLDPRRYEFDVFLIPPADDPVALFDRSFTLDVRDNVTEV